VPRAPLTFSLVLFPPAPATELELVVEPEPDDDSSSPTGMARDPRLAALLQHYRHRIEAEGEYTEEELPAADVNELEAAVSDEHKHFAGFAARVSACAWGGGERGEQGTKDERGGVEGERWAGLFAGNTVCAVRVWGVGGSG
jgi:hypothetical protein